MRYSRLCVVAPALILALAMLMPIMHATTVQYVTLASFDFLSASEISNFQNVTLSGSLWNKTLTSATVSDGELNITNKDTSDALLVYPVTLNGYAQVKLSQGIIAVLNNYNHSKVLTGYEIVKTSSGITVYRVNGTSKTAVTSLSTTEDTIDIGLMDGQLTVKLNDGTGVYQAPIGNAVIALGAPADGKALIDKITLYGVMLAGSAGVKLGTKTITPTARVAAFSYDVSNYKIQSAKLVVKMTSSSDEFLRFYIISTANPGNVFWHNWPSSYIKKGTVLGSTTVTVDVTKLLKSNPQGTIYVGISCCRGSWTVSAELILDASTNGGNTPGTNGANGGTTTEASTHHALPAMNSRYVKYAAVGVGILVIIIIIILAAGGHGHHRRGQIGMLVAGMLMLLIIGGITAAVLAWLHPEWLMAISFGLGALAILTLVLMFGHGKSTIPNPVSQHAESAE